MQPIDESGEKPAASTARLGLLGSIVEDALDAIVVFDESGTVHAFNLTAENVFGYALSEMHGERVTRLLSEPYGAALEDFIAQCRTSRSSAPVATRITGRRKNGSTFPLQLTVTPFRIDAVSYFTAIARNVSAIDSPDRVGAAEMHQRRLILDCVASYVGILSPEGVLLDANRAAFDAAAVLHEDVIGRPFADISVWSHSPEMQERVRAGVRRAAAGETTHQVCVGRMAGELRDIDVGFSPLRDSDGAVAFVIASGVDVTDRLRAEEALRRRLLQQEAAARLGSVALKAHDLDELLQAAVETVSTVLDCELCKVLELSADGGSLLLRTGVGWHEGTVGRAIVSAGLRSQAGYTLQAAEPVVVFDMTTETRFSGPPLLLDHGVVSGASVVISGRDRPYGILGAHTRRDHRFSNDDVYFLVAVANIIADFNARTVAEERLRREEALSETLLSSLPGVVCLADDQNRLVRWTRRLEIQTGYGPSELQGMKLLDLVPEEERPAMTEALREVLAGGQRSVEGNVRAKDGTLTPFLFSGQWLEIGDHAYMLGMGLDISERRRLENQLRQAQKMEAFGQLAGGVAHDFNNLLTVILGSTDLLQETLAPQHAGRLSVEAIREAAERGGSLTRQLLAFSRRAVHDPRVLDLNVAVRETEKLLRRLIGEDVVVTTVLDPALMHVKADPGLLGQILMNLAVNARDAMPTGGELTIETRDVRVNASGSTTPAPGRYALLIVADTGAGMTPEVKARVFEPFFTTKGPGRGTGLGLAVVDGIARQSGVHVDVHSQVGVGTRFELYFPVVDEPVSAAERDRPATSRRDGTETVMVVEDEEGVRRLITLMLEKHGYTVLAAADGEEALQMAERHPGRADLLVTDVVMPGLNGREVASALQRKFPGLKVLYLSGYTEDAVVRHGILHEEVAFLQKPFTGGVLLAKVRTILDTV